MVNADETPWAPADVSGESQRFRPDRILCEDGFCLGVLRVASAQSPFRGVVESVCPICGRSQPLTFRHAPPVPEG
jgi:hypothetical protein